MPATDEVTRRDSPHRLGRYLLRYEIASGGMGTVYLAQLAGAKGFGKWVAIKWVHAHLAKDGRFVRMLIDEAKTMSSIDHPGVCQVLDFVEDDTTAYIVMEYLHGESLVSVLRVAREKGGLPVPHAVRIAVQVARGLHAAHEARGPDGAPLGVVHRDISPHNVHVLYSGGAKVLDFGIALARGRLTEETATGEVKGKPAYMAPEQILGGEHDRRADVWALGVVLWEMLTERRLFRADNDAQTLHRVLEEDVKPPSHYRQGVSPQLDQALLRALERDVSKRFATAAELADALESAMLEHQQVATESHVAAWMEQCHGEARTLRESLLRARFSEDAGVLAIDLHGRTASRGTPRSVEVTASASVGSARWMRRRAFRLASGVAAALVVVLLAVAVGSWLRPSARPLAASVVTAQPEPSARAPERPRTVAIEPEVHEPTPVATAPVAEPPLTAAEPATAIQGGEDTPSPEAPPGRINVLAVPAGEVFFRGERLGETPLVGSPLPAGRQRLEIRWGEERRTVTVRVRSDHLTTLTVRQAEQ